MVSAAGSPASEAIRGFHADRPGILRASPAGRRFVPPAVSLLSPGLASRLPPMPLVSSPTVREGVSLPCLAVWSSPVPSASPLVPFQKHNTPPEGEVLSRSDRISGTGCSRPFQAPTSIPLKRPEHSCLESLSATTAGAIYPSLLPGCGPRPRGGSKLTSRVLDLRWSRSSGRTQEPTTTFLPNEAWHTLSERGPKGPSSHPSTPSRRVDPRPHEEAS